MRVIRIIGDENANGIVYVQLCPSCETRRRAEWAAHVVEHGLPDLPCRQVVFRAPRVLRRGFVRDRSLLGEFVRTAYEVTRQFLGGQSPG